MGLKKIVFALPSLKTGGGNRVVIELSNELVKDGIEVDICFPLNSKEKNTFKVDKRINFISVGTPSKSKMKKILNILTLFKMLKNTYVDEPIVFTDPIMSLLLFGIRKKNIYRFIQADDYKIFDDLLLLKSKFVLSIYKYLTRRSYKYRIKYIFNSKFTYDSFIKVSQRRDVEYNLIYPALNPTVFYNQNIRKKSEVNICIIARKHPWKGFVDFIEVFNRGEIAEVNNVYVISHDDLTEFDLTNVTLIKPQSDKEIAEYMNKSHIFVSTSWWEGFGLPPLEAMSCGCGCVISYSGGVNEYAKNENNCLMFSPKNRKAMKDAINTLITNERFRVALANKAQDSVRMFTWSNAKKQMVELLLQ